MGDLQVKLPPISIKAEPLFTIQLPFGSFSFTNSMLFTLIVMAALVLFFAIATRRMRLVPSGSQNFAETVVEFLLGTVEGTAGRAVGRRIFPLIATLFLFIIVANWSGLLPGVGTIGQCVKESPAIVQTAGGATAPETPPTGGLPTPTGHECPNGTTFVPFLRGPNADLNTTLAMALIAVAVVQIAGIASHGLGGYIKELTTPLFLAPVHIIGEIARVISLSFRLFGNIFGGEVLVTVMYALLGSLFLGFGTAIFLGLEVLFGFIQALIFSILTLVFISIAVAGHGGEEHAAPHGSIEEKGQQFGAKLTGQKVPAADDRQVKSTATHIGG